MVINIPKGPSNRAGLGATPGTQQTAQKNVAVGNFNPNMPREQQVARQGRSSYQQSLAAPAATPTPMAGRGGMPRSPLGAPRAATAAPQRGRIVSRGGAPDPGRGYNMLAGLAHDDLVQMNQRTGLSNVSVIPSLRDDIRATGITPEARFEARGRPTGLGDTRVTGGTMAAGGGTKVDYATLGDKSGDYEGDYNDYNVSETINGTEYWFKSKADADAAKAEAEGGAQAARIAEAKPGGDGKTLEKSGAQLSTYGPGGEYSDQEYVGPDAAEPTTQEKIDAKIVEAEEAQAAEDIGLDPEAYKQSMDLLDQKYSVAMQQALSGLDRQMAMMGTFGSGSHIAANNALAANLITSMADEYNELNMMNLAAIEQDFTENSNYKLDIIDKLMAGETLTQSEEQFFYDSAASAGGAYGVSVMTWLQANQKDYPAAMETVLGAMIEFEADLAGPVQANVMTYEEALQKYKDATMFIFEVA
jgi:hypothetical protein